MTQASDQVSIFIALLPEDSFAHELFTSITPWFESHHILKDKWKMTLSESAHMSICFLGKQSILQLPSIINATNEFASGIPQISAQHGVVEFSGIHNPNIVWFRFERNFAFERLVLLAEQILGQYGNWKNTPARTVFSDPYPIPHITLATAKEKGMTIQPESKISITDSLRDTSFSRIGIFVKRAGESRHSLVYVTNLGPLNQHSEMKLHPTGLRGWDGSLKELARTIANMRFDALSAFFYELSLAMKQDSESDKLRNREQLSSALKSVSLDLYRSSENVYKIFEHVKVKLQRELDIIPEIK